MALRSIVQRFMALLSVGICSCLPRSAHGESAPAANAPATVSPTARQVTLRFTFDPKRKWPADQPMTVAIPALDSPLQSGTYRLTNVLDSREIKIDGNLAVEVTPRGRQPFSLELNLKIRKTDLNPLLKAPHADTPPLPDEAKVYLTSSKWINLDGPLLREAALPLKGKTDIETVRNILAWMKQKVGGYQWPRPTPLRSVDDTIRNGYGDCGAWSDLFVGLCRANGVPARVVRVLFGYGPKGETVNTHMDAEVFIRGTGWMPVLAGLLSNETVEQMMGANEDRWVLWFHCPPGTDRWEANPRLQMAEYMLPPNDKSATAEIQFIAADGNVQVQEHPSKP